MRWDQAQLCAAGSGLAAVAMGTAVFGCVGAGQVTSPPLPLHPIYMAHLVQGTGAAYLQSHSCGSHMTCLYKPQIYPYMVALSLDVSCDLPAAGIRKIGLVALEAKTSTAL